MRAGWVRRALPDGQNTRDAVGASILLRWLPTASRVHIDGWSPAGDNVAQSLAFLPRPMTFPRDGGAHPEFDLIQHHRPHKRTRRLPASTRLRIRKDDVRGSAP